MPPAIKLAKRVVILSEVWRNAPNEVEGSAVASLTIQYTSFAATKESMPELHLSCYGVLREISQWSVVVCVHSRC
jgi:hypothetical protein